MMATDPKPRSRALLWYSLTVVGVGAATFLVTMLLMNIHERKREAEQFYFPVAEIPADTTDPEVWGRNFPRQYDSYKRTVDQDPRQRWGSDGLTPSKLESDER